MRRLVVLLFVLPTIMSFGQDYKLFHQNTKALYASVPFEDATYGIAFDSVVKSGMDSIYYNYTFTSWEIMESDTCQFWGGPYCYPQNVASWIGSKVYYDNISMYTFLTNQNDTLLMDFDILVGDSSRFYLDSEQQFYIVSEGTDMQTILGLYDSVRNYRITHYDLSGNTIFSELQGKSVRIGGGFGLIDFFRVDSFPTVLQSVSLLGDALHGIGITQITNEMIYDHQAGDVIQYYDMKSNDWGPPYLNYRKYITHTFLERTDLVDSIIYLVDRLVYDVDSNSVLSDTITLKYLRDKVIAEIPFDKINQQYILYHRNFHKTDYCDFSLWTYKVIPEFLIYCEADNCWGPFDIPGPPPNEEIRYVAGLGIYRELDAVSAPPPEGYAYLKRIVYFMKNGIECGEQIIVNLDEDLQTEAEVAIYPNPTRDKFEVRSVQFGVDRVEIYDLSGKKLFEQQFPRAERNVEVDISGLDVGMYVCRIFLEGHQITKKLLIH